MSILPRRDRAVAAKAPMSADWNVPDLRSDPRVAPARDFLTELTNAFSRLEREAERLAIERELRDRRLDPTSGRDLDLKARLLALQGDAPEAQVRSPSPQFPSPVIAVQ